MPNQPAARVSVNGVSYVLEDAHNQQRMKDAQYRARVRKQLQELEEHYKGVSDASGELTNYARQLEYRDPKLASNLQVISIMLSTPSTSLFTLLQEMVEDNRKMAETKAHR